MFMFQTLKLLPAHVLFIEGEVLGIVLFGLAAIAWMLVPFWKSRSEPRGPSRALPIIGVIIILYIIGMTVLGYAR